jgi:hypothetical protein
MRRLLISLLLASAAATPALADPGDNSDRQATRAERQQAREARAAARSERSAPAERALVSRPDRGDRTVEAGQPSVAQPAPAQPNVRPGRANLNALRAERAVNSDSPGTVRNWRGDRRQQMTQRRRSGTDNERLRETGRPLPNVMRTRVPVVSPVAREGTQPPLRVQNRRNSGSRWNTDWRRDGRYDWRNYRNRHGSRFRLGFYSDPFGWGYRPYSIGWRLWPSYYSSNYWINDPWEYRLPYAPPGTRWIRYYDDALLVDTWSGQVVDVIHNFFW